MLKTTSYIFRALGITTKESFFPSILCYLGVIIFTTTAPFLLFFSNRLTEVIMSLPSGQTTFSDVVVWTLPFAFVCFLMDSPYFIDVAGNFIYMNGETALYKKLFKKLELLKLEDFENQELYNKIEKAKQGLGNAIIAAISFLVILFMILGSVIGAGIYLATIKPQLSLILVFLALPQIISYIYKAKKESKLRDQLTPVKRQKDNYYKTFTNRLYYKETRLLGAVNYFYDLWMETFDLEIIKNWKTNLKVWSIKSITQFLSFLGFSGSFILATYYLIKGDIGIGAIAAIFIGIGVINDNINWCVQRTGQYFSDAFLAKDFFDFIDMPLENELKSENLKLDKEIKLKNISFNYPGTDKNVINEISLKIKKNENLAIVGLNGAGKTTITKLIAGLYIPNSGTVKYDDTDISKLDYESRFKLTSAVFQDFCKYQFLLKENIAISDIEKIKDDIKIKDAAHKAHINYEGDKFPDNLDTMLSREFDGVDVSGGEWQRIAIARGYFRDSEIIILDEPTAAIDPIAESVIYNRFMDLSKDKTTIIVTHRLASAKLADRILLMENGKIIESGTHDELIKHKGKYAEMFNEQAKWYKR